MIGKWIDALTDEQRDNIVTAQGWRYGGYLYEDGTRCLVGNALDLRGRGVMAESHTWPGMRCVRVDYSAFEISIERCFDHLCKRFGTDRIVRMCKVRAGAKVSAREEVAV